MFVIFQHFSAHIETLKLSVVSTCCFTLLCFFPLVFLCSVSTGFIVVLPRKPGKVAADVVVGRVKPASQSPTSGAHSLNQNQNTLIPGGNYLVLQLFHSNKITK